MASPSLIDRSIVWRGGVHPFLLLDALDVDIEFVNCRIAIDADVVSEYAAAMADGAEFPPLVVFVDGDKARPVLASGFHRYYAAVQAGINALKCEVRQGTRRDALLFSAGENATHGLRRTNADKRKAVMALVNDAEWSVWNDCEIARRCGVSNRFVSSVRAELSLNRSKIESRQVRRGETIYTMRTGNIGRDASDTDGDVFARQQIAEANRAGFCIPQPFVTQNTGNNEWYTPPEYIAAAKHVMGNIDLDPASTEKANQIVRARTYYTKEQDGLMREWRGQVWMNPPYASELIGKFCEKLARHVIAGDVSEAIVLVNNATETEWFSVLINVASAVVFPLGRVRFLDADGIPSGAPLQGQAVIYIGKNSATFLDGFGSFGWGARLVR